MNRAIVLLVLQERHLSEFLVPYLVVWCFFLDLLQNLKFFFLDFRNSYKMLPFKITSFRTKLTSLPKTSLISCSKRWFPWYTYIWKPVVVHFNKFSTEVWVHLNDYFRSKEHVLDFSKTNYQYHLNQPFHQKRD